MPNSLPKITARHCSIHIERNRECLAQQAEIARTMSQRMIGLLGRKVLAKGDGLVLLSCQSIHMVFMQFSIDALFIDDQGEVVRIYHNLAPWAMTSLIWKARAVIELPSGTAKEAQVQLGDQLLFEGCQSS